MVHGNTEVKYRDIYHGCPVLRFIIISYLAVCFCSSYFIQGNPLHSLNLLSVISSYEYLSVVWGSVLDGIFLLQS